MVDHGDDFGTWLGQTHGRAVERSDEQWLTIARYVRHAANKLSPTDVPLCLPGEPQECGRPAQQHVVAWAAQLKALAHNLIEEAAPTPAQVSFSSGPLYQRHLAELRQQDAAHPADR
ncbi:hypothetical protein ABZ769_00770 [Streptomyces olivoreticuli]